MLNLDASSLSDKLAPLVWIVILHWQAPDCTRACLKSLKDLNYPSFKILLIDNGSPDNSGPGIAQDFPEVEFLCLKENLGFAGGCNKGIEYCLLQKAEWIWLLNNDTQVAADSLQGLMDCAASNPRAAALGGMVYTGEDGKLVASGPGEIDFLRAKTFLRQQVPSGSTSVSCQWISGSNLLLKTQALSKTGAFDEDYFLYFEDTELCHRLRCEGWDCLLVPSCHIEHRGSASTQGDRKYWRDYYYSRNRLLFFSRNLRGVSFLPALASVAGHLIRHAIVLPFRGRNGRKQLRAEYLGLRDFMLGRLGKATCLDWCSG